MLNTWKNIKPRSCPLDPPNPGRNQEGNILHHISRVFYDIYVKNMLILYMENICFDPSSKICCLKYFQMLFKFPLSSTGKPVKLIIDGSDEHIAQVGKETGKFIIWRCCECIQMPYTDQIGMIIRKPKKWLHANRVLYKTFQTSCSLIFVMHFYKSITT